MAVVEFFQTGTAVRQNAQRHRRKNRFQPVLRRGPGGGPGEGGSKSGNKSRLTNAVTKGFAVSASPGRFLWYFLVRNTRKYTYCLCTAGTISFRSYCGASSLQILMQSEIWRVASRNDSGGMVLGRSGGDGGGGGAGGGFFHDDLAVDALLQLAHMGNDAHQPVAVGQAGQGAVGTAQGGFVQ